MSLINVRTRRRKNPQDKTFKYYGEAILYSQIGREDIIDAATRNSQIPRSYLEQTFDALIVEAENFVMNGHSITLDRLGTIYCTLRSKGVSRADLVTADTIQRVKFHYKASPILRKMAQRIEFRVYTPKGL